MVLHRYISMNLRNKEMKKHTVGVYAGTFDPITNGHLDLIKRASRLYDVLYVTIFENQAKKKLFTLEERLDFIREATKEFSNVVVDSSDLLAVEYAKKVGATVLVRGLRATTDFEYELQMAFSNQFLDDQIEMVFLMTKSHQSFISSSSVKEIASLKHDVSELVPPCVDQALKNKFQ